MANQVAAQASGMACTNNNYQRPDGKVKCCKQECMVDDNDSESENMIECCSCEGWQHIKCLPYTKTQVKLLTSDEILWKCDACCKFKSKTKLNQHNSLTQDNHTPPESNFEQTMRQFMLNINTQMNTVLESLKLKADKSELVVIKQDIQQMNNRISTLEVSKQPSNTAGIETMISEALIEEREKERRKLNLTVGGLPESTSHVPEDRQRDDEAKLMEAFHSIGADVVPESVKRFGKVNPDKPRLLMVKMPTMKDKGQTLKFAWKLNNSNATKNLYMRPDLTPLQQKGRRDLVAKLRKKKASVADPEDWKIDYRRWEVVHKHPQPTPNQ